MHCNTMITERCTNVPQKPDALYLIHFNFFLQKISLLFFCSKNKQTNMPPVTKSN